MSEDNLSPWQRYKKNLGESRPWDILNPAVQEDPATADARYEICLKCPELIQVTKQCKKCGCFMVAKTKIKHATCPLGKW
jgi:hypothetical protein